jgi:hypothetical protein
MGATFVLVLSTRGYTVPARRSDLVAWVNSYRLPVTSVIDAPDEAPLASQRLYGPRDTAFLVDLSTMRIVARERTFTTRSAFLRILPELVRRLGTP